MEGEGEGEREREREGEREGEREQLTTLSFLALEDSPVRWKSGALKPVVSSQLPCRSYAIKLMKSKYLSSMCICITHVITSQ